MMRLSSANLRGLLIVLLLVGFIAGLSLPSLALARDRQVIHAAPLQAGTLKVIINEIAWAGTEAAAAHEWIELYNPDPVDSVDLTNWKIVVGDGDPVDIIIPGGMIGPEDFFLLERVDSATSEPADYEYNGGTFANAEGEVLELWDNSNTLIDTANNDGGAWPVPGGSPGYFSMERTCVIDDGEIAWRNNDGVTKNGLDDNNNEINGTPGQPNSTQDYCLLINEVAWPGTKASPDDEWIELYNPSLKDISLDNWRLVAADSTPDINFPDLLPSIDLSIVGGGYILLERREAATTAGSDVLYSGQLNDDGEILRLRAPNGTIVDTANSDGGRWPAGCPASANSTYPVCNNALEFTGSMERMDDDPDPTMGNPLPDTPFAWVTNVNPASWTHNDAANNPVHGTPKGPNWGYGVEHTPTPRSAGELSILINEVAWMGTLYSSTDEWIELYNPGSTAVNLDGWQLISDTDSNPTIDLSGFIDAGGYFVIAANDYVFDENGPNPPSAELVPNLVYGLSLNNEGEVLALIDPSQEIVDTANSDGGVWPAGVGSPTYASMERRGEQEDEFFAWSTYSNPSPPPYPDPLIYDRGGNLIKGTPGQANWGPSVTQTPTVTATPPRTATPTRTPTKRPTATAYLSRLVLINEFLARPGSDWNHDGLINVYDEFIEVINADSVDINLKGWQLDDAKNSGSEAFVLPDKVLKPGQRAVYYGLQSNILLSDGGDTVRLIRSNGEVADQQEYNFARFADVSECQYPEGPGYFGVWRQDCFPTPGTANQLTGDLPPVPEGAGLIEPVCLLPDTLLEDFRLAECNGYGEDMWNAWYWDKDGWGPGKNVEEKNSQWDAWVE